MKPNKEYTDAERLDWLEHSDVDIRGIKIWVRRYPAAGHQTGTRYMGFTLRDALDGAMEDEG